MAEIAIRFFIGGLVVSAFALIADLFKPKSFAGLFGSAPSVALASLGLTVASKGHAYAALEARSMVLGAIAFLVYAATVSVVLMRKPWGALPATLSLLALWAAASFGLWSVILRGLP